MNPTFSITDNGDGTATVLDGGVPVITIYRDRGNRGSAHSPNTDIHLAYVAQGVNYRPEGKDGFDDPTIRVSCASRSTETKHILPGVFANYTSAAEGLYVAGMVAVARGYLADGTWTPAEVRAAVDSGHFAGDVATGLRNLLAEVEAA